MKRNIKFNHQERRMSKSSSSENSPDSPTEEKTLKMGPRKDANGSITRPSHTRTDTGASDWATEDEAKAEDDKVR